MNSILIEFNRCDGCLHHQLDCIWNHLGVPPLDVYVRVFTGLSEQKRPTLYVSVNILVSGALGFVKGGNEENEWNPSVPCCLLPCLPKR